MATAPASCFYGTVRFCRDQLVTNGSIPGPPRQGIMGRFPPVTPARRGVDIKGRRFDESLQSAAVY